MAEILIKIVEATATGPHRGLIGTGLPVAILPAGHPQGERHGYIVIRLPGASIAKTRRFFSSAMV